MYQELKTSGSAAGLRIGLVVSRYHESVTNALRDGALDCFKQAGGDKKDLLVAPTPGGFELIAIARTLAYRADLDGVVALGCIISGETTHDKYLAHAISNGIARIITDTGKPIAFGVLTCQNMDQAQARAGGSIGNKGVEAMAAEIEAINAIRTLKYESDAP